MDKKTKAADTAEDARSREQTAAMNRELMLSAVRQHELMESLESLVEERTAELRESEERFRLMVSAVKDYAIFMLGPTGEIVTWNEGAERLKGYTASEIIGKNFASCFYAKEDVLDGKPARELEYAASRGSFEDEGLRVRKDGSTFWASVVITALRDADGKLLGYSKVVRDITERKRAEEELRKYRDSLEEQVRERTAELLVKNARLAEEISERKRAEEEALRMQKLESLRVLAGGIAHDLNNMMVAVEANAGLALMVLGKDSPVSEYLIGIEDAAEKVAQFSKQILSFTGKAETKRETVHLNEIVKETARLLLASVSRNAALEYALSDDLPAIEANTANIQQVVMNLIINASEALGNKKGTIKVSTGKIRPDRKYLDSLHPAGLPEGDYVFVEVSDIGCGISPETRRRIFDPFYTTKFTGRGLGLSSVLGIVSVHGGAIGVESEEGCGATFRVLLPVSKKLMGLEKEKPVSPEPEPAPDVRRGKCTVLVVDDEEAVLLMAKKVLERAGYKVLTAADGSEAIDIFRENHDSISAVIIDLIMPHVRGDEAMKEIRKIKNDVNILLLSGYHEIDLTGITGGPGKTAFLEKPYRIKKLLGAVQDILKA